MRRIRSYITGLSLLPLSAALQAQSPPPDEAFGLGQITVTATKPQPASFGDDVASSEEMWRFNTLSLDEAVKLVRMSTPRSTRTGGATNMTSWCAGSGVGRFRCRSTESASICPPTTG